MINSEYILFAGIGLAIIVDLLRKELHIEKQFYLHALTLIILVASFLTEIFYGNMSIPFYSGAQYSYFINGFLLFLSVVIYSFIWADGGAEGSTYLDILFLLAVGGAMLVVLSSNLLSMAVAIEMLSIASYGLVYFQKSDRHLEAAVKYLTTSVVSMAILLFGISLVFAGSGTLSFTSLYNINFIPFVAGVVFVVVGLAFKSTLVPFHMWAPDVYEASDSAITAFLSSISKTAGLVALIRIFFFAIPVSHMISTLFLGIALVTIFFSIFLATVQDRIKRILAYSSISQAGFAFIGLGLFTANGLFASVFYIFSFAIADALIFLAYRLFEERGIIYRKDAKKMRSVSAIGLAGVILGLLSLAGFPPTIGFFGKLLIFESILGSGYVYILIALFFILLFSTFYYFGLLSDTGFGQEMETRKKLLTKSPRMRVKEIIVLILILSLFAGIVFA